MTQRLQKGKMLYLFKDALPKRESEKKTRMNALQAISNLQDRGVDRAIASRYVAAADDHHADKENKKRKIPWCSGSISMMTATKLIKSLTGNDIKKLSGLDDVKTDRGRELFFDMRRLAGQLCSLEETLARKRHLSRQVEHSCSCLICGFWSKGTGTRPKKVWVTLSKIPLNLFRSIISSTLYLQTIRMTSSAPPDTSAHARNVPKAIEYTCNTGEKSKSQATRSQWCVEEQQIEEMLHEIVRAKEGLDEYRSHLSSRLKTEAEFDQKEF
jgi:hypothetical protein